METKVIANTTVKSPSKEHSLRKGKGFSLGEIKEAGKTVQLLNQLNIQIDYLRKSMHQENIEKLKKLKIKEKKKKKKKPYVFKEKKRTPFKPMVKKIPKKKVKKEIAEKKAPPKKKLKPVTKEKIEKKPKKIEKEKVEIEGTPLTTLSGLGPSTEKKFIELGVNSVEDLIKENPEELSVLIKGVSEERIQKWIEEGKSLISS
ncbi:MAG: ribosomal protein L13e [Candidatus Hodarchaeota archaeon]